jgi:hypothetical protein
MPTGFSSTTDKGGNYVREVHAVTWSYTDTKDQNKETVQGEIRLLKIIKIVQPKILEAYSEVVSDGGEEGKDKK